MIPAPPTLSTASRQPHARRRDPRIAVFASLWLALLALAPSHLLRDPGTFWHVVVGERMLSGGHVIDVDPFSFTHEGDEWLAQQWLGECAMAFVHHIAGLDGVVLLAVTLIAAVFAVIFGRFVRTGIPIAMAVVATTVVIGASSYHFIPRPHLATFAGMAFLMLILLDVEAGRVSPKRLWWLPPIFVLWVNTHGGVLGGLASLIIFAVLWLVRPSRAFGRNSIARRPWLSKFTRTLDAPLQCKGESPHATDLVEETHHPDIDRVPVAKPRPSLLATIVGLCTIAVLVNPYGPGLPRVWFSLMGSRVIPKVIIEHAPLSLLSPEGMMICLLAAAYFWTLFGVRSRGLRVAWLLPAIWFVLALSRVRHGPLFAIVAALAIADMIPHHPAYRKIIASIATRNSNPRRHPPAWPLAVAIALAFSATLAVQSAGWKLPVIGAGRCVATNRVWPVDAVALLEQEIADDSTPVHVFNEMRFGGYLTYAAPNVRIYIDDRCELHRDPGLKRYVELQKHPDRILGEAARYGFDYALIRTGSGVHQYMAQSPDWLLLHSDDTAALFQAAPSAPHRVAIAKPKPQR